MTVSPETAVARWVPAARAAAILTLCGCTLLGQATGGLGTGATTGPTLAPPSLLGDKTPASGGNLGDLPPAGDGNQGDKTPAGEGKGGALLEPGKGQGKTLSGTVVSPDPRLVGNSSAALISDGGANLISDGGANYRLASLPARSVQGLREIPVASATLTLVDAAGVPIGTESVISDDKGFFEFKGMPAVEGAVFVRAAFRTGGKTFAFETLLPATGDATADIDAASTLVARKVRTLIGKGADTKSFAPAALQNLTARLQETLGGETLPFMASDSLDVVPAFDQLAMDLPEIQEAARGLAPALAEPTAPWQVKTLFSTEDFLDDGNLAVDKAGSFYIPSGTTVYRVSQQGVQDEDPYAELPTASRTPIRIAFSPAGRLFAAAGNMMTNFIEVSFGCGKMRKVGIIGKLEATDYINADLLRGKVGQLVVDDNYDLFLANPAGGGIMKLPVGSAIETGAPEGCPDYLLPDFTGFDSPAPLEMGDLGAALNLVPSGIAPGGGGSLLVVDADNSTLSLIGGGATTVLAGARDEKRYRNGRGGYSRFQEPAAVLRAPDGTTFVADARDRRIRRLSPQGSVFLVAGSGAEGHADGAGPAASFHQPIQLALDGAGNLYVVDRDEKNKKVHIRMIRRPAD